MKKTFLLIATLFATMFTLNAQSIDEMYFNARGSFDMQTDGTHLTKGFSGDFFNFVMAGQLNDNISYRIRQRLNKRITSDNPFNATDFLYINWKANEKWTFSFGKQEIYIGGFEYDYAPIDVYFWSECWETLPECYSFAASAMYNVNENQQLIFQVSNSPFYSGLSDKMSYNIAWFGQIAPWWKTMWSVNESEHGYGEFQNIISLGNRFEGDSWYLEADFVNRYNSHSDEDFFGTHWGLVGKFNYNYKDWNFFAKASYDKNNSFTWYGPSTTQFLGWGGYDHTNIGCGLEYFPLHNEDLRLHAAYNYYERTEIHAFTFGVTWKLNIIKK